MRTRLIALFSLSTLVGCTTPSTQGPVEISVEPIWDPNYPCAKATLYGGYEEETRWQMLLESDYVRTYDTGTSDDIVEGFGRVDWTIEADNWLEYDSWTVQIDWWSLESVEETSCRGIEADAFGTYPADQVFYTEYTHYESITCTPTNAPYLANCVGVETVTEVKL